MSPTKVALELEDFIVSARKQHPTWGPKKLRAWILHHHPELPLPAPSTVGDILRRRGLTQGQLRKPRSKETARQPFADVTGPNATWCADFKGTFATGDGLRCSSNQEARVRIDDRQRVPPFREDTDGESSDDDVPPVVVISQLDYVPSME